MESGFMTDEMFVKKARELGVDEEFIRKMIQITKEERKRNDTLRLQLFLIELARILILNAAYIMVGCFSKHFSSIKKATEFFPLLWICIELFF